MSDNNQNNVQVVANNYTKDKFSIPEVKKENVQQIVQQVNSSNTHRAEYREKENKVIVREFLKD